MKAMEIKDHLSLEGIAVLARVVVVANLFFPATVALARPRAPLPPLPEVVRPLYHESFDGPYFAGATNAGVTVDGWTLKESWSGYALERSGSLVTPFIVPAVDGERRVVACDAGAVRFWFRPDWSSASGSKETGPGVRARLIELTLAAGRESEVVWSLQPAKSPKRCY